MSMWSVCRIGSCRAQNAARGVSELAGREVELRALKQGSTRVIRMACRKGFPRPQALKAVEKVIRKAVPAGWLV